jgi:predicted permease
LLMAGAVKAVGSTIGPVSMIILGMLLASISWQYIFMDKRIYLITAFRMVFCPALVILFLKYSGMTGLVPDGSTILLVSLLAAAAPSASMVTQMAQIYGRNAQYASAINVVTTLCCIVTMPLMVMLYMM